MSPEKKAPEGTPEPAVPESYSQMGELLKALVDGMKGIALTPESLKEILMESGKVNAEEARRARWPENTTHPAISAFSYPEGDVARPKPRLLRKTYFCGIEEDEERLTPGEIEAFNAISQPREVRGGSWRAEIHKSSKVGGGEALFIFVPKETVDQRMQLPSLHLILHELNGGPSTENVMDLLKQLAVLKQMVMETKQLSAADLEAELIAK